MMNPTEAEHNFEMMHNERFDNIQFETRDFLPQESLLNNPEYTQNWPMSDNGLALWNMGLDGNPT